MKRFLRIFAIAAMLTAALMILPIHGESEIYDRVIRLHVLADSDSKQDQEIKLHVRDAVLKKTHTLLENVDKREDAEAVLRDAIPVLEHTAAEALRQLDCEDAVSVTLGEERYPTRQYESLAFPAGEYLSLRVMIGSAEGQNWWCVLFPPLCLTSAVETDTEAVCLSAGLTGEQYRMIADTEETKYKLRFKILEVAEELFN